MRPSPGRLNAWLQSELERASYVITYRIIYLMELQRLRSTSPQGSGYVLSLPDRTSMIIEVGLVLVTQSQVLVGVDV